MFEQNVLHEDLESHDYECVLKVCSVQEMTTSWRTADEQKPQTHLHTSCHKIVVFQDKGDCRFRGMLGGARTL